MRVYLVPIVALALALGGCKKASPVGTWTSSETVNGINFNPEVTFNADGTFKSVSKVANGPNTLTATDTGNWTLDGDKLTIKMTDVDWQFSGTDQARIQKAQERVREKKQQIIDESNKNPTETIKWNGNDEFSADEQGKTTVYHRKS